jgi:myo-inositol-1(or 4)-monophosphatase
MTKLEVAIKAAVSSGDLLLNHYGAVKEVSGKESLRDVVSDVDKLSEIKALSIIEENYPGCVILSEENGLNAPDSVEKWVIDALDGTVNYIHNFPFYCVSISYWVDDKPVIGVVYNPHSNELFYAEKGAGAFLNQVRLSVKNCKLENGLTAMAFSGKAYNPNMRTVEFEIFGKINDLSQGCLRTGSAAMNLCYLADGRFSLALGKANKAWDIGAGLLIAEEAGAVVEFNVIDEDKYLVSYIAGTKASKDAIEAEFSDFFLNV